MSHIHPIPIVSGLVLVLLFLLAPPVSAEPADVQGSFQNVKQDGLPAGWSIHTWEGYAPFPKVTKAVGPNGSSAMKISDIQGPSGGAVQSDAKFPARSGDTVRVSFLARGKGVGWVTCYRWGAKNQWNGTIPNSFFPISDTWQAFSFVMQVDNGHACQTKAVNLAFGLKEIGTEMEIANLQMDVTRQEITGDRALPTRWTIFPGLNAKFEPSRELLENVPAELNGVKAVSLGLISGVLDLSQADGQTKAEAKRTADWIFTEIESKFDCEYTIAAVSLSELEFFLNGELVFKQKAVQKEMQDDPEPFTLNLKEGKNVLVLKKENLTRDGKPDKILNLWNPKELRSKSVRLNLVKQFDGENFDGKEIRCSGNPELIQGNPTPGLLTLTGQGVFKTEKETVKIDLPNAKMKFPKRRNKNQFAAAGLRIQHFGEGEKRAAGTLRIAARNAGKRAICTIEHEPAAENLALSVTAPDGKKAGTFTVPYQMLPADFLFGVNLRGKWCVYVQSLSDSQALCQEGELYESSSDSAAFTEDEPVRFNFLFARGEDSAKPAEVTLDNLTVGGAVRETRTASVPFKTELLSEFDPVKAGWKMVFSDEFNGKEVDLSKWYYSDSTDAKYASVHDGLLEIKCDWNEEKTKVDSASLYSNELFGYGYYETRVKFRQQSGWWSAFWLCTHSPSNPFIDGWEIDIYEDYYMGPKNSGEPPRAVLDHNLHVFACGTLRSWNYNSQLPGSPDDFYVVGCKWTPFEVSYYLNGKLIRSQANHSPYESVTFDPFHHALGLKPLHAILSGCCGRSGGDPAKGKFPESFYVDYVRIYEFPQTSDAPRVKLTKRPPEKDFILMTNDMIQLEADVKPGKSGSKIKAVYLFDSGALLDCRTQPPYSFEIPITAEYYGKTDFVRPGRSGIKPDFDRGLHAYCIFAQDEDGNVGHCEPIVRLVRKKGNTGPWQGKPHQIPGIIPLPHFDVGGQGIAYSDSTLGNTNGKYSFRPEESVDATPTVIGGVSPGEWLKYTVNVKEAGKYDVRFHYGTPLPKQRGPILLLNNQTMGVFEVKEHEADHFGIDSVAELKQIEFPAGEHELILLMQGGYNIQSLEILKAK